MHRNNTNGNDIVKVPSTQHLSQLLSKKENDVGDDSRKNATNKNTKRKTKKHYGNQNDIDQSIHYAKIFESYDKSGKPKRVITIAYRVYPERPGMNVEYAASMFRKDNEQEDYNRRSHIQTARGRLAVRPLYTTLVFPDIVRDNLLEKNVPKTKQERRIWAQSDAGREWKETRRNFDKQMSKFLRKEVGQNGCGAKHRLHRSEIERARVSGIVPISDNNQKMDKTDRGGAFVQLFSSLEKTGGSTSSNKRGPRNVLNNAFLSEIENFIV
jgi:hypothetical protein